MDATETNIEEIAADMSKTEIPEAKIPENGNRKPKEQDSISIKSILVFVVGMVVGIVLGYFIFHDDAASESAADSAMVSSISSQPVLTETETSSAGDEASSSSAQSGIADEETADDTVYVSDTNTYDVNEYLGTLPMDNVDSYVEYMMEKTNELEKHLRARWALSQKFIESGELQGASIEGFLRTPREYFVREDNYERAYADSWLPIGWGATITDPDVVAMMTTTLDVKPEHRVLEIGTGSGYQSAILSNISNNVYSIEIIEPLFYETNELYISLTEEYPSYDNIRRKLADGYYGWEEYAPFDRIIVTCSIDHLPPPLLKQLSNDGIMVVPLGNPSRQYIMEVKKTVDEEGNILLPRRDVYNGLSVKFIPFRDVEGVSYSEDSKDN